LIDEGFAVMKWARSMDEALLLADKGSVMNWEGLTDGLTMYYALIFEVFAVMDWEGLTEEAPLLVGEDSAVMDWKWEKE
jgi:hypothetical protein